MLGPDIAVVRSDRLLPEDEQIGLLRQTPDLAIEIMSPSDSASDVIDKVMRYFDAGVGVVWVMDPQRRRVVAWNGDRTFQELHSGDTLDGGALLAGFRLPLSDIFR